MDTSETYIKMCDCEEVQEHRKYDGGDWICDPDDGHSWAIWQKVRGVTDEGMRKFMDGLLWLPRQDQIQEMMKDNLSTFYWVESFYEWLRGLVNKVPMPYSDMSLEQLWLLFYMHEKHQKTWDGDKWVSNK